MTRLAYHELQQLADQFGQATYLARREGARSLVWLSLQGAGAPHLTMPPGMWSSLTGSATGRVLLAFDPSAKVLEPLLDRPVEGYPDPVPTQAALDDRLAQIAQRGFDYHGVGEANAIYTLVVPVLDHRECAIAAIGVAGFWCSSRSMAPNCWPRWFRPGSGCPG